MPLARPLHPAIVTGYTIALGVAGAALAQALSLPAAILIGPALVISAAALCGLRLAISDPVRDVCFVALGLGIGAGFDPQASAALLRWPLAFAALLAALVAMLLISRFMLERGFGFDRRDALLAGAPGHLSFVLSIAASDGGDVARIAVVQSIRLLALTLVVPFAARATGYEISDIVFAEGQILSAPVLAGLAIAAVCMGLVFRRLSVPGPLLLGAMAVSAVGHVSDLTPGLVPTEIMTPAFVILGVLIGTRFADMSFAQFRASFLAGLSVTLVATALACVAAIPVALALAMPAAHVMAGFAPGGLETMIVLGVVMGASPGFVAACHVMRLLILSVLVPVMLGRSTVKSRSQEPPLPDGKT